MKDRTSDADGDLAKPTRRCRVGKKVVREQRMEIENGMAVEACVLGGIDQKLDRILVIENHLRLEAVLLFRFLAELNQACGIEQRVGVALEAAGIPRKVDQQPVQDLQGMGARRLCIGLRAASLSKTSSFLIREIEGLVRAV